MGKYFFDITNATVALVVLSPLLLIIGILIKFDSPGGALFFQERIGRHGKPFRICKFRTMIEAPARQSPLITSERDQRITSLGRILRATKLDELPQLINVVCGTMSLVGPRPEVPKYVLTDDPVWREVLSMRPGITGTTQLRFRNEERLFPPEEDVDDYYRRVLLPAKLQSDLEYIRGHTFWGDIRLIIKTLMF